MEASAASDQGAPSTTTGWRTRWSLAVKILVVAGLVALALLAGRQLGSQIPRFAAWVESLGALAPLVFVAGYAVAAVAFVPGSLLTLAAGAIFGLLKGTLAVFAGATLGAALAFLVSRHLARSTVQSRLGSRPRFEAIDRAVARSGFRVVLLLRLSPVFPFNFLNYALGLTGVRFVDYLSASIGMLPATFLYVYYGATIGQLAQVAGGAPAGRGTGYWVLLVLGLIATITVTALVTRLARRALDQEVQDD